MIIEDGDLKDDRFYHKLRLNNVNDYIIDNELYSIYRKGVQVISVPEWTEPNISTYKKYTSNFRYNLPRLYTLFKLNGHQKSIVPFMIYQYKLNEKQADILKKQYDKFKNVLFVSTMNDLKFRPPYERIEPRYIEESIYDENGNYYIQGHMGYSTQEKQQLYENKLYTENFKKTKNKFISAAIVFKEVLNKKIRKNPDQELISLRDSVIFKKSDGLKKLNEIKNLMKDYYDKRYIIKETRYLFLNKENGRNSLFYRDKDYFNLSIQYYNELSPDVKKRLLEIENKHYSIMRKLLKEKQNEKKLSYGITHLQDKVKITNKDLSGKTKLSIPTVRKYRKKCWKDDNEKLF